MTPSDLANLAPAAVDIPGHNKLGLDGATHPPRILILYGSLRPQSYSRKLALEAERLLRHFGAETRVFDPHDLPVLDSVGADHPKVRQLREWSQWSEGQVWVSPERHGTLTAVFKNQIDWLPLEEGGMRPTQGRTLAVMQVCGGSQSFNVVNALRQLGRWMRIVTIPNQSSVPKAWQEFYASCWRKVISSSRRAPGATRRRQDHRGETPQAAIRRSKTTVSRPF